MWKIFSVLFCFFKVPFFKIPLYGHTLVVRRKKVCGRTLFQEVLEKFLFSCKIHPASPCPPQKIHIPDYIWLSVTETITWSWNANSPSSWRHANISKTFTTRASIKLFIHLIKKANNIYNFRTSNILPSMAEYKWNHSFLNTGDSWQELFDKITSACLKQNMPSGGKNHKKKNPKKLG